MQQLTAELSTRKEQTAENLRKAFKLKLLELCNTGTKKSCSNMFNLFVDFAGQYMVTDAGRLPCAGAKSKQHDYDQKHKK